MSYENCPFCNFNPKEIILKNDVCYAIYDKFPVNEGHILIIPFRHFDNYFDATANEIKSIWMLLENVKDLLDNKFKPNGFNIGINVGKAAGQTISHLHIHLIPRYYGDMENPKGGVRGVIPAKRIY